MVDFPGFLAFGWTGLFLSQTGATEYRRIPVNGKYASWDIYFPRWEPRVAGNGEVSEHMEIEKANPHFL